MIPITSTMALSEDEVTFEFVRASGPGGQNVNKVATAVQLRFDVAGSASLPADVRQRLMGLAGRRLTTEGVLIIDARNHRTQERNRAEALARLVELIRRAAEIPKVRRRTGPSREAKKRRLEAKGRQARIKQMRGKPAVEE